MNREKVFKRLITWIVILIFAAPPTAMTQETTGQAPNKAFSEEQLTQILAPIALYPDSLLSQILMASTYPLEVVQACRWAKQNKNLKGDALAKELEKQSWDPSVKSLVNFPQVLDMMNEKLDWTTSLGDAFLAQQKDVMDMVQKLRIKAKAEGNLKNTAEQKVILEKETQTIIIESASPQVVYVPVYNPTVVYGPWWYPAYPPYYYYPPAYPPTAVAYSFAAGVAIGAAWGYAWGHCNWHGGDVDIDVNRNIDVNHNINRDKYANQLPSRGEGGRGSWQHNPEHRKGVAYRDQKTSQRFGQSQARTMENRQAARGYGDRGSFSSRETTQGRQASSRESFGQSSSRDRMGGRDRSAFSSSYGSGRSERMASQRGSMSRGSFGGSSRSGGGFRGGGGGRGRR
ncbi:conserved exported hypothetical protein [uncultured Desulfobacterium sp.]|uniref:DUF3300 domain-containing protein n=1 Tax=uncultured Desulfobacterium sp. TaxID=201089 RepID=A0A445N1M5_9BACT|nr:conserved exported hypothetical protein [uncultured Desulfobacterium sp.]